jgi:hypothetical protein
MEDIDSVNVGMDVLTSGMLTVVASVFVAIALASSGGGVAKLGLCPQADINVVISTVIMMVRICASFVPRCDPWRKRNVTL